MPIRSIFGLYKYRYEFWLGLGFAHFNSPSGGIDFNNLVNPPMIDLWCNGNTSDFGSEVVGSNPVRSTIAMSYYPYCAVDNVYAIRRYS